MTASASMPFTGDETEPNTPAAPAGREHPAAPPELPPFSFASSAAWPVPDEAACHRLWNRYDMPEHIRAHSRMVADMAVALAGAAASTGAPVDLPSVLASALLHDIAKDYTIRHGGNHAQLGGAWTLHETRNPRIAQGVMHHVHWPWRVDMTETEWLLPFIIIYADKRVKHDRLVTLEERFDDLVVRYGRTERIRERIRESHEQAVEIELALSAVLGIALHRSELRHGALHD